MDACQIENKKHNAVESQTSPPALPESCSSLVALSGRPGEPRLHLRSELTDPKSDVSSSSTASLPDAPLPSNDHCDPCDGEKSAHKQTVKPPAEDKSLLSHLWFNAGLLSYHPTDHSHQFNDLNYGFGMEYEKSPKLAFAAGEYRNSNNHNSYYGMVEYRPLHVGPVHAGIAGGTINGYPYMFHGNFFPAAMPMATIEEKHFGANFVYIPQVKGVVPALSMQMKVRF